jgi:hypothetical protein
MRWIQILLLVIVLELGVIAVRLPIGSAQASGPIPVCITSAFGISCLGTDAHPLSVQIER